MPTSCGWLQAGLIQQALWARTDEVRHADGDNRELAGSVRNPPKGHLRETFTNPSSGSRPHNGTKPRKPRRKKLMTLEFPSSTGPAHRRHPQSPIPLALYLEDLGFKVWVAKLHVSLWLVEECILGGFHNLLTHLEKDELKAKGSL